MRTPYASSFPEGKSPKECDGTGHADSILPSAITGVFQFSSSSTLATRPLLLYYAAMSLALAEVLVKGTGDIRLPKLREHHAAHGLSLVLDGEVERRTPTQDVIRRLRAVPQIRGVGVPYGTFEVWKKLVREPPIAVRFTEVSGSSSLVSLKSLFVASA